MRTKCLRPALPLLVALLIAGCSRDSDERAAAGSAEKPAEAESSVKRGTNGEVVITLDAEKQRLVGLQVAPLESAQLNPELKGYGRVLDTASLAAQVAELAAAQAASTASAADLKRLQALAAQNDASERALQTAEATAARDKMQVEATRLRLLAGWGAAIAGREDLPAFTQSLASLSNVLIEIDLPAGGPAKVAPTGARLMTLGDGGPPLEAQLLGPAPAVDPQMQGRGFYFLVSPNSASFAPGVAVTGFLALPGQPQSGVAVPREAIIRFQGATWIYRQSGGDTFERVPLTLEAPLDNGWFVREGVNPGDKVVIVGAQQLLSEELKGQGVD